MLSSLVNQGGQVSSQAPVVCLHMTSFHAACECQMYYLFFHPSRGLFYLLSVISPTYLTDCLSLFLSSL